MKYALEDTSHERINEAFDELLPKLIDKTKDPFEGMIVLALAIRVFADVLERSSLTREEAEGIVRDAFKVADGVDVSAVAEKVTLVVARTDSSAEA